MLERLRPLALNPLAVDAFAYFIETDLGLRLHEAVRALKIALSRARARRSFFLRAGDDRAQRRPQPTSKAGFARSSKRWALRWIA